MVNPPYTNIRLWDRAEAVCQDRPSGWGPLIHKLWREQVISGNSQCDLQLSGGLLMQTTRHCYYVVDTYIQVILCFEGFVHMYICITV